MKREEKRRLREMRRVGRNCHYCGKEMQARHKKAHNYFTLDHIVPKSRGGKKVVPCCIECNQVKADSTADAFYNHLNVMEALEYWRCGV